MAQLAAGCGCAGWRLRLHGSLPGVMSAYPSGVNLKEAGFAVTADAGGAGPTEADLEVTMPWQVFWFFYHIVHHNR